ncbi:DNA replication and repair protein RecR [Bacteroidales bacterium 6E]|nr:DNA replication and repair protein RecR [Bacteroidales bacterium 6E]
MHIENFSSRLLENAVNEFAKLPGIGRKTALRLVLHMLRQEKDSVRQFGESIIRLREEVVRCKVCFNISDTEVCSICSNTSREGSVICVVENIRDVMSIENTHQFNGKYHVLGGIISPVDGIAPSQLEIDSLVRRVGDGTVREVILALPTTMEGDTTNFYIYRKLKPFKVTVTTLARGISVGDDLEYTDEITLGRSILHRVDFESSLGNS